MSAYNGSGTFVVSGVGLPYVTGTTISSTVVNQLNTDLATGLSTAITKDGQTTTTASIPFANGLTSGGNFTISQGSAAGSIILNQNTTNGAASYASVGSYNSASDSLTLNMYSPAFTTSGITIAQGGLLRCSGAGGLNIATAGGAYPIRFYVNSVLYSQYGTDGSFLIGTTTDGGTLGSAKLAVEGAGAGSTALQYTRQTSTGFAQSWRCDNSGGAFLNLTFNGTTQIGSILITGGGTGVQFNTSSDERLKNITGPLTTSGAFIDALQPKVGAWKLNGEPFAGLVAQDVLSVSPSSVGNSRDEDGHLTLAYASPEIIANLIAEVKSLRARIAALGA